MDRERGHARRAFGSDFDVRDLKRKADDGLRRPAAKYLEDAQAFHALSSISRYAAISDGEKPKHPYCSCSMSSTASAG